MKNDIMEKLSLFGKKIKAVADKAWQKTRDLARRLWDKMKGAGAWLSKKTKKLSGIIEEKLAATLPEVSMKVKRGVLISLGAIIAVSIASAITINSYAKDLHEFENDKCQNCGISSSLVYKFKYISESDSYSVSGRGIWNGRYDEVILPETYKGKPVTEVAPSAFDNATKLYRVVIPEGVKAIGDGAFIGCKRLTEVTLPNGLLTIGEEAFCACPAIATITLPDTLTTLDVGAFYNCTALGAITLPDSVESIGDFAFEGCKNLKSLKVGSGLSSIGDLAFAFCSIDTVEGESATYYTDGGCLIERDSMTVVIGTNSSTIPEGVKTVGAYSFSSRYTLAAINLPDSVTAIAPFAFFDCESLKDVSLGGGLKNIGYKAFYSCASLKEITLPVGLEIIDGEAFSTCEALAKIIIPDSVTKIGSKAFSNCGSLTEVVIGKGTSYIGDKAFLFCHNITSMTFSDPNGWKVTKDAEGGDREAVSSELLANKDQSHTLLTNTYKNYHWFKN